MRSVPIALLIIGVLTSPVLAYAEPSAADRALAESLFQEARALIVAGDVAGACPKLTESFRLDPQVGALLYAATCHEQEGKIATAWIEFTEAATMAARARQPARERMARRRADALAPRLTRATIAVAGAPEATITLDGRELSSVTLGMPIPLDPGEHVVTARAPGKVAWSKTFMLESEGTTTTIEVPALADEKMRSPPPPSPVEERTSPPSPPRSTSTTGWILGGAGGLSIGFGLYMGGLMFQRVDHAEAGCAGRYCTQEALDMFDEARAQRAIAVTALGVGLALVAGATYLILRGEPSRPTVARAMTGDFAW